MLIFQVMYNALLAANESFEKDKRLTGYLFLGRPWGMVISICLYLLIVLKWLPRFMADRKPFKVESIMKIYNIIQILINLVIFYESLRYSYWRSDFMLTCEKYDPNDMRPFTMKLTRPVLLYYFSKYLDTFDTIFFLLRKKYSQVTFLHVYHHSLMIFAVYAYCTFLFASHFTVTGVVNSFIHVVMYTYYLVAAIKPNINLQYWKRILTKMQLLQFTYLAIHYSMPLFNNWCNISIPWITITFLQNLFMITLFSNFYYNTYIVKDRQRKLKRINE